MGSKMGSSCVIITTMETFDAITNRTSTRGYEKKPIEKALLEKLVDAGRRAPTARAVEPWEFVVVTEKAVIEKLGALASPNGTFIKDSAACIAVYCKNTKYYLEDGVAATENILLAVEDLGLGACWVAGDKKPYAGDVSKLLSVPPEFKLISLIPLGYPQGKKPQQKKRNLAEVIHWERF